MNTPPKYLGAAPLLPENSQCANRIFHAINPTLEVFFHFEGPSLAEGVTATNMTTMIEARIPFLEYVAAPATVRLYGQLEIFVTAPEQSYEPSSVPSVTDYVKEFSQRVLLRVSGVYDELVNQKGYSTSASVTYESMVVHPKSQQTQLNMRVSFTFKMENEIKPRLSLVSQGCRLKLIDTDIVDVALCDLQKQIGDFSGYEVVSYLPNNVEEQVLRVLGVSLEEGNHRNPGMSAPVVNGFADKIIIVETTVEEIAKYPSADSFYAQHKMKLRQSGSEPNAVFYS